MPDLNGMPAHAAEPWSFNVDPYERDHDQVILDCLLKGTYGRAYEAGCGGGELTEQLAKVCARVIASDLAPSVVARARIRCGHLNNVSIRCADLAEHLPEGPLDLVILREIAQPMNPAEMLKISLALSHRLAPRGQLVALHGIGRRSAGAMAGEAIHNLLSATLPLEWVKRERGVGYRLDSWLKH